MSQVEEERQEAATMMNGTRQSASRKGLILCKPVRETAKGLLCPGHPQNHLAQMSRERHVSCEEIEEQTQELGESAQVLSPELTENILQSPCCRRGVPVGSLPVFLTHIHTSARGSEIKAKLFLTELRMMVTSLNLSWLSSFMRKQYPLCPLGMSLCSSKRDKSKD